MRACQCINVCAQAYGTDPREQAERVFEAIRTGVHYVLAENEYDPGYVRLEASSRVDAMLSGGRPIRPTSPMMSQLVFNPEAPLPEKWLAQKAKEAAAEESIRQLFFIITGDDNNWAVLRFNRLTGFVDEELHLI